MDFEASLRRQYKDDDEENKRRFKKRYRNIYSGPLDPFFNIKSKPLSITDLIGGDSVAENSKAGDLREKEFADDAQYGKPIEQSVYRIKVLDSLFSYRDCDILFNLIFAKMSPSDCTDLWNKMRHLEREFDPTSTEGKMVRRVHREINAAEKFWKERLKRQTESCYVFRMIEESTPTTTYSIATLAERHLRHSDILSGKAEPKCVLPLVRADPKKWNPALDNCVRIGAQFVVQIVPKNTGIRGRHMGVYRGRPVRILVDEDKQSFEIHKIERTGTEAPKTVKLDMPVLDEYWQDPNLDRRCAVFRFQLIEPFLVIPVRGKCAFFDLTHPNSQPLIITHSLRHSFRCPLNWGIYEDNDSAPGVSRILYPIVTIDDPISRGTLDVTFRSFLVQVDAENKTTYTEKWSHVIGQPGHLKIYNCDTGEISKERDEEFPLYYCDKRNVVLFICRRPIGCDWRKPIDWDRYLLHFDLESETCEQYNMSEYDIEFKYSFSSHNSLAFVDGTPYLLAPPKCDLSDSRVFKLMRGQMHQISWGLAPTELGSKVRLASSKSRVAQKLLGRVEIYI